MSQYRYQPIDVETQTRVLVVQHGEWDDDIICTLSAISLDQPPEYETLSYVWGNSVIGDLNDADPDTEAGGWLVWTHEAPKSAVSAKLSELAQDPNMSFVLFSRGYPKPSGRIYIDGIPVTVGGELYSAIKQLRQHWAPDTGKSIPVWIDALCINQNNISERNKHVMKMGKIYAQSKRVRIWLGTEVSGADALAFDGLYELYKTFEKFFGENKEEVLPQRDDFLTDDNIRDIPWDSISSVLNRAWFDRVWVIQEVAYGPDAIVHLGNITVPWRFMASVISGLRQMDADLYLWSYKEFTTTYNMSLMEKLRASKQDPESPNPLDLLNILQSSRNFKCTNLSDKIYAVLSLANDGQKYIQPDYSLSPEEVYKGFTIEWLTQNQSYDILYCCSKPKKSSKLSLPSWVPDWTQKCHHYPYQLSSYKCKAAKNDAPNFRFTDDKNTLIVRGRIVEAVKAVEQIRNIPRNNAQSPEHHHEMPGPNGEPLKVYYTTDITGSRHTEWREKNYDHSRQWMLNVMHIAFPEGIIEPRVYEALWRTFVCNQTEDGEIPPPEWGELFVEFVAALTTKKEHASAAFERFASSDRDAYDFTENFTNDTLKEKLTRQNEFLKANGLSCYNRRFYKTDGGTFGWGPDGVSVGDVVAILDGGNIPFLLSPVEGGYKVVGDCYIHGFMNGEAMNAGLVEQDMNLV